MPLLRGDPYRDHGCPVCRESYATRQTIDDVVGSSAALQSDIFRCRVCGTYWQETGRGIAPITRERADWALESAPARRSGPAEFLLIERPTAVLRDGLVAEPPAPAWPPGPEPTAGWKADVLAAITRELGFAGPYLLRWTTAREQGLVSTGYGIILAVDSLDWARLFEKMLLGPGITPDSWSGTVRRIGFNSLHNPVRGPNEIVAMGAGADGRRAVQERDGDFARWRR